jgi:hypothetical protein
LEWWRRKWRAVNLRLLKTFSDPWQRFRKTWLSSTSSASSSIGWIIFLRLLNMNETTMFTDIKILSESLPQGKIATIQYFLPFLYFFEIINLTLFKVFNKRK